MNSLLRAATLALSLVLLPGCGSGPTIVPVKGVVTRNGKPVASITLTFYPPNDAHPSGARTDEDGHFELKFDRTTQGVMIGESRVVAVFRPRSAQEEATLSEGGEVQFHPEQRAILEKYGNIDTTPLTIEITKAVDDLQIKLD